MIRRFRSLKGAPIAAADGEIGRLEDFYFDDRSWTVRHLVIDTGGWLSGRRVLVSPRAIVGIDPAGPRLMANLARAQVEQSPHIDTSRPVSQQHDATLAQYYGYPFYWTGPYRWGAGPLPTPIGLAAAPRPSEELGEGDPHLRSASEVTGYGIEATDGELGHVEDFLVDEESWAIRYLIGDPRSWWPGEHVVLGIDWLTDVHWDRRTVSVDMTREAVRNAPPWRPDDRVDRGFETRLYRHHGRPGYWDRPPDRWLLWPPAA
jgi:hypothetical protein